MPQGLDASHRDLQKQLSPLFAALRPGSHIKGENRHHFGQIAIKKNSLGLKFSHIILPPQKKKDIYTLMISTRRE